ncbi:UDP-glucose 4-epimerase GalE [Candidatus Levyibacteriota bacterium]|nr:UDP-glucose 4-epimerase GalE [Candidatus Levybacteria bacterium]GDX61813.1 UDP-glucose 4-epimerase GalE [Candidatus Levybacteria bacterium]
MTILVTGGAGYIGSFMVKRLVDKGDTVIVIDNLVHGHRSTIESSSKLVNGNILDKEFISKVFSENKIDAVIHFAAYISMGESMRNPGLYFENNTFGLLNILEAMQKNSVKKIIFSSTAGVYGDPVTVPIPEDHQKNPNNPYGESKLMSEKVLQWYWKIFGIQSVALRYFNACGAALDGSMGEDHPDESHLIPNAIKSILNNKEFILFGNDYDTPDGTCIRDYIHVLDLVDAHALSLDKLENQKGNFIYNVGTGIGYSNKEVLITIERVSGRKINIKQEARREGDAHALIADVSRIKNDIGFVPQYSDLETIIKSAWEWHTSQKA